MTLEEALSGPDIPKEIRKTLDIVQVTHLGLDGSPKEGQLVVHQAVAQELKELFAILLTRSFPIEKIVPIVAYHWDDGASMAANNTSAFNYRVIAGTIDLSNHALGLAIDINPAINPYVGSSGVVLPLGATYDPERPGTLTHEIASLFKARGWTWGGDWSDRKDWQHFEKVLPKT